MTRPRIIIETVTAEEQRAPGNMAADWYVASDGVLVVKVTADVLGPDGFLLAMHVMVEAMLCLHRGIPQTAVEAFDAAFKGSGDPGDHLDAPNRVEHRFAMLIQHLLAHELGLSGYGEIV